MKRRLTDTLGRYAIPFAVLGVSLLITASATVFVVAAANARDRTRFENLVDRTQGAIHGRIETYINLLRGAVGLFATQSYITRAQFHSYVEPIELGSRYRGIQGIGIAGRITPQFKEPLVKRMRNEGFPGFTIFPEQGQSEYVTILYLEPLDERNRVAIGFDMFTEPTRRAAMEIARDSAEPAASGKVTLVQEIDANKQAGFLIYMPGYFGGKVPASIDDRRKFLGGFIYAPFRADDLLSEILTAENLRSQINFTVYDGEEIKPEGMLYDSNRSSKNVRARFSNALSLDVAGRRWTIAFSEGPQFENSSKGFLFAVPIVGTIVSLLLFALTAAQASAQRSAERAAAELSRARDVADAARKEAEAANRLKDEFLATVSHELRTPLNAILGWSHLLRSGKLAEDDLENGLETIERNAKAQAQLVEDLLDVSRIVSGKLRLDMQSVELGSVIDSSISAVRPQADMKEIQLLRESSGDDVRVCGDPGRLQQIVWNLLSNAVKFTPNGGRVNVRLRRVDGQAEIQVADTGRGIPSKFLPYVFDPFRQADASITRKHGGLGLGLGIAKHLVELHGGTIYAESEGENKGATFTVTFPLETAGAQPHATPASDEAPRESISLHGIRVLIVDDEPDSLRLAEQLLRQYGATIETATSANEAIEMISQNPPDVLVSDIGMPNEDGYSMLRRIRAMQSNGALPAVALTAFARAEDRDRAHAAGYGMHLPKPFKGHDLAAAIAKLAGRTETQAEKI